MGATLDNFYSISVNLIYNPVFSINSPAPISCQIPRQPFWLSDAFIPIPVNIFQKLQNTPKRLFILPGPIFKIFPRCICPCFNHRMVSHGWSRQFLPFARLIFSAAPYWLHCKTDPLLFQKAAFAPVKQILQTYLPQLTHSCLFPCRTLQTCVYHLYQSVCLMLSAP